jgi:hypothetical protein
MTMAHVVVAVSLVVVEVHICVSIVGGCGSTEGNIVSSSTSIADHNGHPVYFFYLHSGGWNQGPLDTAATNGLLCQPRVIMIMEKSVE